MHQKSPEITSSKHLINPKTGKLWPIWELSFWSCWCFPPMTTAGVSPLHPFTPSCPALPRGSRGKDAAKTVELIKEKFKDELDFVELDEALLQESFGHTCPSETCCHGLGQHTSDVHQLAVLQFCPLSRPSPKLTCNMFNPTEQQTCCFCSMVADLLLFPRNRSILRCKP